MSEEGTKEEGLKELVLARLDTIPPNFKLSIGDFGTLTKEEMMESVKSGSELGKQIMQMQLNFIKALTSGHLMDVLNNG